MSLSPKRNGLPWCISSWLPNAASNQDNIKKTYFNVFEETETQKPKETVQMQLLRKLLGAPVGLSWLMSNS